MGLRGRSRQPQHCSKNLCRDLTDQSCSDSLQQPWQARAAEAGGPLPWQAGRSSRPQQQASARARGQPRPDTLT